ncbi:MAG: hypothetical protein IT341_09595 [Chloroflexi bacterium]|nr:hypothetical protein [Chloroflexota bacterium]
MRSHIRVLSPAGLVVALPGFAAAIWLVLLGALVNPALAGSDKGEVVFRVTLTGPVDADDHFTIWSRCPDEWCQPPSIPGVPTPDFYEKPVVVCGRNLADQPICSARTYEWTLALTPGLLQYRFEREPDGANDPTGTGPSQTLVEGRWQVHSGRQVLTFEYVYPSPHLPNTAMSAPTVGVTPDIVALIGTVLATLAVGRRSCFEQTDGNSGAVVLESRLPIHPGAGAPVHRA